MSNVNFISIIFRASYPAKTFSFWEGVSPKGLTVRSNPK